MTLRIVEFVASAHFFWTGRNHQASRTDPCGGSKSWLWCRRIFKASGRNLALPCSASHSTRCRLLLFPESVKSRMSQLDRIFRVLFVQEYTLSLDKEKKSMDYARGSDLGSEKRAISFDPTSNLCVSRVCSVCACVL